MDSEQNSPQPEASAPEEDAVAAQWPPQPTLVYARHIAEVRTEASEGFHALRGEVVRALRADLAVDRVRWWRRLMWRVRGLFRTQPRVEASSTLNDGEPQAPS
jgi:hypothetical protein